MAPTEGKAFRLSVEDPAAAGTFVPVSDMNSYRRTGTRGTSSFPVFGRATPYKTTGTDDVTYSAGGFFNPDDAGQNILRVAAAADNDVRVRVQYDGTNGFTQLVKVGTRSHDASPEGLQAISFDFTAEADAAIVGTGPLP